MAQFESANNRKVQQMKPNHSDRINGRPSVVRRAVLNSDVAYLSAAGKKGAEMTNQIKADKAAEAAYFAEKDIAERARREQQANEHIVPIEPDEKEAE